MEDKRYCGYVAIVGRPNVGKSTLLNHLLGMKLSITSRKPQTTRQNLLGVKTDGNRQVIFVDTPGLHSNQSKAINRYMNRAAGSAMRDVDGVVMVTDRTFWTEADEAVATAVQGSSAPLIVAVNKVDRLASPETLQPHLQWLAERLPEARIIPISALRKDNLEMLESAVVGLIPENPHIFPDDQVTDRSERFLAAELIREKITRQLGAELPYQVAVEIESFKQQGQVRHIHGLILVEREGQKKIVIGEKGLRLKRIGQEARLDMEKLFGSKVMLNLWVKVRTGWSDDERALRSLGYDD